MTPIAVCPSERRLKFCAAALALGVLTTIALAWALIFDVHPATNPMRFASVSVDADRPALNIARCDSFGAYSLAVAVTRNDPLLPPNQTFPLDEVAPAWTRGELLDRARDSNQTTLPDSAARAILVTGWPWPCMWSSYDQQPSNNYWWFKARNGIVIGQHPTSPMPNAMLSPCERSLPLRMVWFAFAGDTCFWAALWGALLFTPVAIRHILRRRRGLCLACGYDRRGLAPDHACPECGRVQP